MRVLCLDTATPDVAAALVDTSSGETTVEVVRDPRGAGEHLMPLVAACLGGRPWSDVDAIAVGLGPGPYTGLRVGVVTAAVLGRSLGVPAHGVCSLDAWSAPDVTVVTDARRREVYWALYGPDGARVAGPDVARYADVPAAARYVGPGTALLGLPPTDDRVPVERLAALVDLGAEPGPLVPLYLRRPDAAEPK